MMIIIWIKTRKTILLVCASYWQRDLANKYPSKHFWYLLNSNPVPNWVFSLNLHEILFWSILALKFCSKYIGLLGFFYFRWFIYLSFRGVNKRPKSFWGALPLPFEPALTKALLWIHCGAYRTLRCSPAFYSNIWKLDLSTKIKHYLVVIELLG